MIKTEHPHIFVAVPLPDEIKSVLSEWSQTLRQQWPFRKWVHPSDYHITLQFLGACPPGKVEMVKQHLSQALLPLPPFTLGLKGLNMFGQRRKPRILWADVTGDKHTLAHLQQHVASTLERIGFPREQRPYRPHITLAKHYRKDHFSFDQLSSYTVTETKDLEWRVQEIVLYQTHLGRTPMYEPLQTYFFTETE